MFKYYTLAFFVVILYFLQSFFLPFGGVGADGLSYFGIASDFPALKTNLFPFLYPALLRLFYTVLGDYFWAYKMLNLFMMLGILVFSWRKQFYFKETVLLFTGKTLFFTMTGALSESLFVFLLYFLLYFMDGFFKKKILPKTFIPLGAFLMLLLVATRYSGIYIFIALLLFGLYFWYYNKDRHQTFIYAKFLLLSGLGIFAYLWFNYFEFGSFSGEHLRGKPSDFQWVYFFRDVMGLFNVVNPFIGIKPASNSVSSLSFQFGLMLVDVVLFVSFILWFNKNRKHFHGLFHGLLWSICMVYSFSMFVSGYLQQIEEMNVRMLAPANFCFIFSLLILYFQKFKKDSWLFSISIFFLVFLMGYSLKDSAWYLGYKKQIEPQVKFFSNKKYLFNDEKNKVSVSVYHVPIINKKIPYPHTNGQLGECKQSIVGTVNPQIKWLKYDTVQDKSTVLYTSQLLLKR